MAIPLRDDFDAAALRASARRTKDAAQARRLLALAAIYDGATRTEAARIGGVTLQIVRDWVLNFNAQGPEGLIDRKPPGQPSRLTDEERHAMKRHPRWTLQILERVSAFRHLASSGAHHHERLDGKGYPWALDGESLDETARILAIADVYEALTADRPYRGSLPIAEVLAIMAPDRGLAFDAEIFDVAAGLAEERILADLASSADDAIARLQGLSSHTTGTRLISAA